MTRLATWPSADIAKLALMWLAGTPVREIARTLKRNRDSVLRRSHRDKLTPRPSPINAPTPESKARNIRRAALREARMAFVPFVPFVEIEDPQPWVLAVQTCQFPLWGSSRPTHLYCTADTVPGRTYCQKHHAVCYVKSFSRDEAQYA